MILAIAYLASCMLIGLVIEYFVGFSEHLYSKISFSFIIGTVLCGSIVYLVSLLFGFNIICCIACLLLILIVLVFFLSGNGKAVISSIKKSTKTLSVFAVVLLLFFLPFFLFGVCKSETGEIFFTGNYADYSYHSAIVNSFAEQEKVLIDNPQSAFNPLRYHYMVNFYSAILVKLGMSSLFAISLMQVLTALSAIFILENFFKILFKNKGATIISSCFLLFIHIGIFSLAFAVLGLRYGSTKIMEVQNLLNPFTFKEIATYPYFNFLEPVISLFNPQRPFLLAFPIFCIIITMLLKSDFSNEPERISARNFFKSKYFIIFLISLFPLIHIHTFLASAFILFFFIIQNTRKIMKKAFAQIKSNNLVLLFLLFSIILIIVQISYLLSSPKSPDYSGFDVYSQGGLKESEITKSAFLNRMIFWARAAGPSLLIGFFCSCVFIFDFFIKKKNKAKRTVLKQVFACNSGNAKRIMFSMLASGILFFLLINFYRMTPSWGDSNKLYFFLNFSFALTLGYLYSKNVFSKSRNRILRMVLLWFIVLLFCSPFLIEFYLKFGGPFRESILQPKTFSAKIEALRFCSGYHFGSLVNEGEPEIVEWIKMNTIPQSIFLTSDDTIHFLAAETGRRVVMGSYVRETGYFSQEKSRDIEAVYSSGDIELIRKYKIDYIFIGPLERRRFSVNDSAFERYPLAYLTDEKKGQYRIYDVRQE